MSLGIIKHARTPQTRQGTKLAGLLKDSNIALVGDTLDFETLGMYDLQGTTTNPFNIMQVIDQDHIFYHLWAAVKQTLDECPSRSIPNNRLIAASLERFLFELGNIILYRVNGPHFTFVDPRRHNDTSFMVRSALRLASFFAEKDIRMGKVVVSIPATPEGIRAAQELQKEHKIHTNLYFVSGLFHAAACAEAGATTITITVGRLLDWYENRRKAAFEDLSIHPAVEAIQSTLEYFKFHGIKTKVIGSEFRALTEIGPLAGFDAICISKDQADHLRGCEISASTIYPSGSAQLRARQAQYPTSFLSTETGLMDAVSLETRSMIASNLFIPLGEMKANMDILEGIITKEVVRQLELMTLDLKTLYGVPVKIHHNQRTPKDLELKALRSRRSLAQNLGLEETCAEQDVNDVF